MNNTNTFNIELEKEVIGALIKSNDKVCEVIDILEPQDFYRSNHQIIYKAILDIYKSNKPVDIATLTEKLGKQLAAVGGISYLSEMIGSTLSSVNVKAHAEIVKEKANIRKLSLALNEAILKIQNDDVKSTDLIKEINDKTLDIKDMLQTDTGELEDALINVMNTLENRYKNGGDIQGIPTGFSFLDKTLNGLNRTDFIVLAARPSMGKTAVANNLATNTALRRKSKVSFFSLEMGKEQLLERMIASISNVEFERIKKGNLEDKQWGEVGRATSILSNPNLKIYDKIFTLNGIKSQCKKRKVQEGLDIVIIDYLQLIAGVRAENRQQEISDISRQLKLMAKELDCTVIALSQLSRAPEQRADHRPMLSDLRESGAIEQDADIIMFLYRDEYYNAESEEKGIIENIVAKNRNGELGTIKLLWMPQYQKVGERTMTYEGNYNPKMFERK